MYKSKIPDIIESGEPNGKQNHNSRKENKK